MFLSLIAAPMFGKLTDRVGRRPLLERTDCPRATAAAAAGTAAMI
jgi:hypothetical protein